MTIQEYSNKINNLRSGEKISDFFDAIDLENIVLKISQDTAETYFTLKDFFDQSAPESDFLNSETIKLVADYLGLLFSSEKEAGNVCFANSSELRPEFRQIFTAIDLLDYIYAFMHASFYKEFQKIAITSETGIFWQLVKIGAGIRKESE
ncbi:hypothetical protein [Flavobacterium pectinovorum]|uniref:hypothetical protein n=1 Tax=Flavobacterium pectinovorum TaxID=29533 RepID=UPI001FAE60A1|nr:hypothetical protein [Flavobacterium pectinovorum]MCI9845689.1 hypothetical protein [Flavobacterium pectinovorum]